MTERFLALWLATFDHPLEDRQGQTNGVLTYVEFSAIEKMELLLHPFK